MLFRSTPCTSAGTRRIALRGRPHDEHAGPHCPRPTRHMPPFDTALVESCPRHRRRGHVWIIEDRGRRAAIGRSPTTIRPWPRSKSRTRRVTVRERHPPPESLQKSSGNRAAPGPMLPCLADCRPGLTHPLVAKFSPKNGPRRWTPSGVGKGAWHAYEFADDCCGAGGGGRSEEHTSELQSPNTITYAVLFLQTK